MRQIFQLAALCLSFLVARGDQVLLDFEKARDVNLWEVEDGAPVTQTAQNPLGTGKAMEVPIGTHITTSMLPRDWGGHDYLEFQYVNESPTPVSMLVVLGDLAWLDTRSLWNQYNETFLLAPGKGTLRIPLKALPRGQGRQINLDLKGNVDPTAIVHVEFEFKGSPGRLVIDDLKVSVGGGATLPAAQTPTVVTPAAEPGAPAPAAPVEAGTKMICDFENLRDLGMWEQRGGGALIRLDPAHATHGATAMVITNDTLIITESPAVDWTGHDELQFEIFLEGTASGSVEVMIGDAAWLAQQNYWNRYNRVFTLAPGANTIQIPLSDLFRGEPSRRNTKINRNIDLNAIGAVSLHFTRLGGNAHLDHMRLTRAAGSPGAPAPAGTAAATSPAPPSAAADAGGTELMINDFENTSQLGKWEVRSGPAPVLVSEHVTSGAKAMEVRPGTLVATYEVPRDWSAFEALEVDVHNKGEGLVKVELLIGDDAWTQKQNYWNRHNAMYTLVPGDNTLSIPVNGLYRGEAGARNRDLKGNIDPKTIVFMSLNFYGKNADPALVLDRMRLVRSEGSVPVTGTPGVEPVPVTGTGVGPLIWCGFEKPGDLANWEVRTGPAPKVVEANASEGAKALEIHPGNLLATYSMPRDWSRYASMDFDVFNPGEGLVKLEIVVGDDDWTQKQTYWNRHNAIFTAAPGANTFSIPVGGMYRGEAAARNRDILRNIEPTQINFFSITVHGDAKAGPLQLDHLRLTPAGAPAPAAPKPGTTGPLKARGFDFGPADQALWPGFQAVGWDTVYAKGKGFGLERAQARASYAADTTFPSRLLADYVWIEKGDFLVDLPNGDYQVAVFFEESGYWAGEHTQFTKRGIYAEGKEKLLEDRTARGPHADALTLLRDTEPVPGEDVLRSLFEKVFVPRVFTVTVADGQLNLGFVEDARLSTRVSAVVVLPAGHPGGEAWMKDLLEKNLKELRTKAAGLPLPPPKYDHLPPEVRALPALVFKPGLAETVLLTQVPAAERLGADLSVRIAGGETGSMTFAVHPTVDLGEAGVRCEMSEGGPALEVRAVRHMAKRSFGDGSFRILPWWLDECATIRLPKGLTRQFWVNASAGEGTAAGRYKGAVVITPTAGEPVRVAVEVEVLPFALERPDFSYTFFGMPAEAVPLLARYGVNCLNGGPQIVFKGFQPNGEAAFDFSRSDAFFAGAKQAGMDRMVLDYAGPVSLAGVGVKNMESFFRGEGAKLGVSAEEAGKRVFDLIRGHAEAQGWPALTVNLVDEPLSRELSDESLRAIQFVRKAAPWLKTCGYYSFRMKGDPLGNDRLFDALDVTITKGYDAAVLETAAARGKTLALYSLGKNRFVFGPLMYRHARNGVRGYVQWHSSIIHGYQFLDLDGREPDDGVVMTLPDGACPTLDLERCRMGIEDFRYFQTLAGRAAAAGEAGKAALRRMDELLAPIPMDAREAPAGLDLEQLREEIVRSLLAL